MPYHRIMTAKCKRSGVFDRVRFQAAHSGQGADHEGTGRGTMKKESNKRLYSIRHAVVLPSNNNWISGSWLELVRLLEREDTSYSEPTMALQRKFDASSLPETKIYLRHLVSLHNSSIPRSQQDMTVWVFWITWRDFSWSKWYSHF